jgi:hypothetical protein
MFVRTVAQFLQSNRHREGEMKAGVTIHHTKRGEAGAECHQNKF